MLRCSTAGHPCSLWESVTLRRGPNDSYRGHRIRDAVTLERHRLHGDSLLPYQAKTGTPVYVPLAPHVVEELESFRPVPSLIPAISFGAAREIQECRCRLAAKLSPSVQIGGYQNCRRRGKALPSPRVPRYIRRGDAARRSSHRPGSGPAYSCFGEDHRKELCALCKSATGSVTESVRNAWKLAQSPGTGPEGKSQTISVAEDKRTGWQLIRSRKKTGSPDNSLEK